MFWAFPHSSRKRSTVLHVPLTKAERMAMYGPLSSSMKSALWIHHVETALAEHPDYTPAQRLVLQEAVALFTPELFDIQPSDPEWTDRVDRPLQELTRRAKEAFGVLGAGQLFAHLGPVIRRPAPVSGTMAAHSSSARPIPMTADLPQCECSTTSDYCAWEWGSDFSCVGGGCYWGMNWGCGTLERYRCDGMCQETFGGG
jgi:hypothetical protein